MDIEYGRVESNDKGLMRELEVLRGEVSRLTEECDRATEFEKKYHEAIEEVNRLRERLEERSTTPTMARSTVNGDHLHDYPHQLQTPQASPCGNVERKPKREISPITLKVKEKNVTAKSKKEKSEDRSDIMMTSTIKKEDDSEVKHALTHENAMDALDPGTHERGYNPFFASENPLGTQASQKSVECRMRKTKVVRGKREPSSIIIISSDDETPSPSREHSHKIKPEPLDVELPMPGDEVKQPESTIKVKKEEKPDIFADEAEFAPIQAILDSYPRAELSPTQLSNHPVPRELVSYAWGGGTQVVSAKTGKEMRRKNEQAGRLVVEEYVGLSRIWNPRLPKQAGEHGVSYAYIVIDEPQPMFVREAAWEWKYMGHYTFEECPREFNGELCPKEFHGELWDRLPQQTKRVWLNGFVNAGWGYKSRVILHLWRELGRAPTQDEIMGHTGKCVVTEAEVDKGLSDKRIDIKISLVKFHHYSDEHYDSLVSREGEQSYLEALENAQKHTKAESKGQGKGQAAKVAGKKRKTRDTPQKVRNSKKIKHTRGSCEDEDEVETGESDEDYVPTTAAKKKGSGRPVTRNARR